jgi:hypothetical protein
MVYGPSFARYLDIKPTNCGHWEGEPRLSARPARGRNSGEQKICLEGKSRQIFERGPRCLLNRNKVLD